MEAEDSTAPLAQSLLSVNAATATQGMSMLHMFTAG